ncbi:MAG: RseC/MucC family positive regulator of sigma(E) [Mediterranea massiliensis]|nr:RseC/MucC family positive regulator of sigma(E) [Mediterranea massiliensis]
MATTIKHQGVIETIEDSHIQVRILQTSACASCSIKGHCTSVDVDEKLIDIHTSDAHTYQVGESVWVMGALSMGMKAVLLAFVLPLVILVAALFILMNVLEDELLAVAGSIVCLSVYYILLRLLFKSVWKGKFSFYIQR